MAIQRFNGDVNVISGLSDRPLELDVTSAAELKAKFDEASQLLAAYINGTIVPAIQGLEGNAHTHGRLELLNGITADNLLTADDRTLLASYSQTKDNLAGAVTDRHTHGNKALLDTLSEEAGNVHTHGDLTLLESITKDSILTPANRTLIDNLSDPKKFAAVGVAAGWKELWHNDPQNASFGGQKMEVPGLSECNLFLIQARANSSFTEHVSTMLYVPSRSTSGYARLSHVYLTAVNEILRICQSDRWVSVYPKNNEIVFTDGYYSYYVNGSNFSREDEHNTDMIPQFIIGTKIEEMKEEGVT